MAGALGNHTTGDWLGVMETVAHPRVIAWSYNVKLLPSSASMSDNRDNYTNCTFNRQRLVLSSIFPGRKQLGKDNVLILSCCHNPSCITLGLYWYSAASDIFCLLAVGPSCRQQLANKAVSGLGSGLQSLVARVAMRSYTYMWNHLGLLCKRTSCRNSAVVIVCCVSCDWRKCQPSGPEH